MNGTHGRPPSQRPLRRYWLLVLAVTFSCVAGAASTRPAPDNKPTPRYRFDGTTVLDLARRMSAAAYVPRRLDGASPLQQLTYDQYRDIRFNPEKSIWKGQPHGFSFDLFHSGFYYTSPVDIFI
ncbi:MAG: glucan biosynthesis protein, partial [Steroidobacteraceae bacterium]